MSRGLGWVQTACLQQIKKYEEDEEWPTTFDIAAAVYQVKPDKEDISYVTDAQHVAVKRALEGLQRGGHIIGFRAHRPRVQGSDHRTELCHHWMTERRANKWVRDQIERAHELNRMGLRGEIAAADAERIKTKMHAVGMKVD
jgi:hypothetical protein